MGLDHRDFCRLWLSCLSTELRLTCPRHPQLTRPCPFLALRLFSPCYWHVQREQSRTPHFLPASSLGLRAGWTGEMAGKASFRKEFVRVTPTGSCSTGQPLPVSLSLQGAQGEELNKRTLKNTPGAARGFMYPQTMTQTGPKGRCLPSGASPTQVSPLHTASSVSVSSRFRNTLLGFLASLNKQRPCNIWP